LGRDRAVGTRKKIQSRGLCREVCFTRCLKVGIDRLNATDGDASKFLQGKKLMAVFRLSTQRKGLTNGLILGEG